MTAFSLLNNVDCLCVCVCVSLCGNSTCWDENELYSVREDWTGVVLWPPAGADGRKQL